ncbi:MAG: glycosyltransferase family 2 protein [Dehalococcoidia bacterium]|nr:glycosyltransferase family 2 protein [Dehalococcoidia bacterium]
MSQRPLASVIILTFNGERYLAEVLSAVFAQETTFPFEVIAIDSGSSDRTLEILAGYPVKLHRIPNSEFNHGETRNLGARLAQGDFVAYLTQSATPAGDRWLQYLVDAFSPGAQVGAVYGRHIPRPGCDPMTKRDIEEFFKMMGPEDTPTARFIKEGPEGRAEYEQNEGIIGFYSDANSCLRKSVWEKIPYQPLDYAEDQAFGRDILAAGYWKVYEPRAAVFHSHSYPLVQYFRRQFDEYRGLRISIGYRQEGSIFRVVGGAARAGWIDAGHIRRQPYSRPAKVKWMGYAFAAEFARRFAGYLAAREERLPKRIVRALSLEAKARAKAPKGRTPAPRRP